MILIKPAYGDWTKATGACHDRGMWILWTLLALAYLVIRFLFTGWLDSFNEYASLVVEGCLVAVALGLYDQPLRLFRIPWRLAVVAILFLPLGLVTFLGAGWLHIEVPFQFEGLETLLMLLLVAPALEELLFRFFLWEPLARLNGIVAWITTSVLFSYSHLHAVWFVPEGVHAFIYYQTAYTLGLGLLCGAAVWRYRSLTGAWMFHVLFNLGFYLGARII